MVVVVFRGPVPQHRRSGEQADRDECDCSSHRAFGRRSRKHNESLSFLLSLSLSLSLARALYSNALSNPIRVNETSSRTRAEEERERERERKRGSERKRAIPSRSSSMRRLRLSVSRVVLSRGVIVASRVNGFFTPKMVTLFEASAARHQNEGKRERKHTAVATTTANEEEEEEEDPLRDFPLQNPSSCRNPAARRRLNLAYAR